MSTQLPLGLGLRDDATFDNLCVGDNEQVLASIRNLLQGTGEPYIFLWGERGSPRSWRYITDRVSSSIITPWIRGQGHI